MKKRRSKIISEVDPIDVDFLKCLEDIKRLIRSARQRRGRVKSIPDVLTCGAHLATIHNRSIRITERETGAQALVIPAYWIPLIERLENASFTHAELVALEDSSFDEEYAVEKRAQEIVSWAKNLK